MPSKTNTPKKSMEEETMESMEEEENMESMEDKVEEEADPSARPDCKRAKLDKLDQVDKVITKDPSATLKPGAKVFDIMVASNPASCQLVEEDKAKASLINIWKTIIKCKACGEFMTGPGRAPQICGSCYFSCCSRCVQQMEVPRCPINRCDNQGAYSRNLALQEMADTLVRSGQVEVPLSLEDPTDSLATPRPVAAMLQMTQLTLDALGLQQKEWEQKYLEEMKRNDQARKSRAKKRGASEEPVRSKSAEWGG